MSDRLPTPVAAWLASPGPKKVLSIREPWAWLITEGPKDIENRSWRATFRGYVLIHAGLKWDGVSRDDIARHYGIHPPEDLPTGGILGWAEITECVQRSDSPWFLGPYGFVMPERGPLPFTPCRGRLGFFDAPSEIIQQAMMRGAL